MKHQKHSIVFLSLTALSLLMGWRPFGQTIALAWRNDFYTHLLLIVPLSAFMILTERPLLGGAESWSIRDGCALILTAAAIGCGASIWRSSLGPDVLLSIQTCALVLSWIGFFVLCFGVAVSRQLIFSLVFLFGLVPLPGFAMDFLVAQLQIASAWSAHALFFAFRVPVFQQGVRLTIPGLTIEVAQECSSIRSSSMLIVAALVTAHVLLRTFWRKSIVVAAAVPLSILKNGLRIFIIAMLGTRVDPAYLTGRLHRQGGIVFFAVALGTLLALLSVLRRGERPATAQSRLEPRNVPAI